LSIEAQERPGGCFASPRVRYGSAAHRHSWFTKRGQQAGDDVFVKWYKWLIGTHRIGQYDHMPPAYRYRLPEIEAEYQKWMTNLGG
jgi:hypothetical protein